MLMRARWLAVVAALVAAFAVLLPSDSPTHAATAPAGFDVSGLDLHDGEIVQVGGTYYLYGTEYKCGFTWGQSNTPWCGFGVSTSTDKVHWSAPQLLFSPNSIDPWTNTTWVSECGSTGAGCFNPRMIQRSGWGPSDGVWILWFNAPADWNATRANPYYAMGCEGPAGPCGAGDGGPDGSTHKPNLGSYCGGNGDFALVTPPAGSPVAICTDATQTLSEEQLDFWGTNGDGVGSLNLAGLTSVEAPGAYFDSASAQWVMTYSDPNCGYCSGDGTGYATAPTLLGPWTAPANPGVSAPATGRRDLSATSCGGQPRTVSTIDGYPYQGIDLWTGALNETTAGLHFEPLMYRGGGAPGALWQPFNPWLCQ